MRETDWTKVLGWPGYRVYRHEIEETAKTLKLWVRRKRGNRKLVCSGCGRKVSDAYDTYEREVRDLPCFEFRRRWWWNCIGCAVRTAGSRRRKCRSCRARRRSASASKRQWGWPVRVRRCGGAACGATVWVVRQHGPSYRSALSEALGGGMTEAGVAADGGG